MALACRDPGTGRLFTAYPPLPNLFDGPTPKGYAFDLNHGRGKGQRCPTPRSDRAVVCLDDDYALKPPEAPRRYPQALETTA